MYTPKHFAMPESDHAGFIHQNPMATLVIGGEQPTITQCPLIYNSDTNELMGHLAFNNPFLESMSNDTAVTALFSGNQGYISANWYAESKDQPNKEVPTWNYSSVEITGQVNMADETKTRQILEQQTAVFESRVDEDWRLEKLSESQIAAMIKAIRGFAISVTTITGKQKLSQNKSQLIQERLLTRMQLQSSPEYEALILAMQKKDNP